MPEIGTPAAIRETVTQAYRASFTFTCGTTAYNANDVVGAGSATAAIELENMGPKGAEVMIDSVWLRIDHNALISGEGAYRLALFNVAPPSALNDSQNWTLPSGDRDAFLGFLNIGTPVDEGDTLWVEANGIWKQVTLLGTSIFAYLLTSGAYTPSARVFKCGVKTLLV